MALGTPVAASPLADKARILIERELETYRERTPRSQAANERAWKSLPLGVPSSFQYYPPAPVVAVRADGPHLWDVDGRRYLDFNMGYGALFVGHRHPAVIAAVTEQLERGTLFVTPSDTNALAAELVKERFNLDLIRFTNSGTEATHDAIRTARAFTGRDRIVKVEGGYHGHHDEVMVSMKPSLDVAGPADDPTPIPASRGIPAGLLAEVGVVPYNNLSALERALAPGDVACFIVEPAMENIGICLPERGYLQGVRELCDRYGTLLIFDEVKTGITAGWGGATSHFGVQPDLIALAKSIGGGLPVGAFGGRRDVMDMVTQGHAPHLGTYNGNPLCMAAVIATLRDVATPLVMAQTIARNHRMVDAVDAIIDEYDLPAHTVRLGAKGCVTWSRSLVRNYREYKATDFDLAYAQWIWGINRGILLPPGLDEQWLVSVLHTEAETAFHLDVFEGFARAITGR